MRRGFALLRAAGLAAGPFAVVAAVTLGCVAVPVETAGRFGRSGGGALLTGTLPPDFGGCAGLARRSLSSSGALSNRRIIEFISS